MKENGFKGVKDFVLEVGEMDGIEEARHGGGRGAREGREGEEGEASC